MDMYRVTVELGMSLLASSEEEAEQIFWDNTSIALDDAKVHGTRKVTVEKLPNNLNNVKEKYSNIITEMVLDRENNSFEDIIMVAIRAKNEIDLLKNKEEN